jgi:hypothetical protein
MPERIWARWQQTPVLVKVAIGALVISAVTLPFFIGVGYALDPEPLPSTGLTTIQSATVLGLVFLLVLGWLLLLAYLLLRRSRLAWLFAVGTALLATGGPGGTASLPLDLLGRMLGLATWLPLLAPQSLRWFWQRPAVSDSAYGGTPDLRRAD